jgi:hypothetical protein
MSFSQLQLCLPPVPPSTRIMGEFLHLFHDLGGIHSDLNSVEKGEEKAINRIQDLPEKMKKISNVFNKNVKYICDQIKGFKPYKSPGFETFLKNNFYSQGYTSITPQQEKMQKDDYEHKDTLATFDKHKKLNEIHQLEQLGTFCGDLCAKITGIADRITALNLSNPQVPKLNPIDLDINSTLALSGALIESRMKESQRQLFPAEPLPTSVEVEQTDVPLPFPSVDVSVICDAGTGNTLGVCHDPLWAEKPIAFTSNEGKWTGRVPVGKEWKFVILQNGQPSKWENVTPNRRYDEANTSVSFSSEEVKFA